MSPFLHSGPIRDPGGRGHTRGISTRLAPVAALDEDKQQQLRRGVAEIMTKTPFIGWLGLEFDRYEPDDVVVRLPFREELTNDGTFYHGGAVAATIDTAGAAAVWSNHDFEKGTRASTIAISIQYVGACKRSDLLCHATCVKRAKELSFAEIRATDADGAPVAHAVLTYRIVP